MEHVVQFAISVDDHTIQKRLEESAYNDILDHIEDEWKRSLPLKRDRWLYTDKDKID